VDKVINILNNFIIPVFAAVFLESLLYFIYYSIKKNREERDKYLKRLIIFFFIYVSFNLGYEIGVSGSFIQGLYEFVRGSFDFISYGVYGCIYYLLFYLILLIYFSIRKKKDVKKIITQRMSIVFLILVILSIVVLLFL